MLPLTFIAFAVLTGTLILLRLRWPYLSPKTHTAFITAFSVFILLYGVSFITHWDTSSDHLNAVLYWAAVAGYEFFVLLFTLLPPRWLTTTIAIVLIVPVLSASPFLPLAQLFNRAPHTVQSIGPDLTTELAPWGTGTAPTSGFDLTVYSHPSWTHFFRRRRQACHYFSGQCDASHASATLQPDGKHVLMSCPAVPDQSKATGRYLVVKLY